MFQALYQRYGAQLSPKSGQDPEASFPWPASYSDKVMPIEDKPYSLKLSGQIEIPWEKTAKDKNDEDSDEAKRLPQTELNLSWEAFLALPKTSQVRRTVSAQGWSYKTEWTGVLLSELIKSCKLEIKPEATWIKQTNLSDHSEYLPLQETLDANALLCYQGGRQALSPLYGGPLWLMVFHRYNYKGLGQLSELAFIDESEVKNNFWESKGYSAEGLIKLGNYYAFDLSEQRTIEKAEEVRSY